jgi:hypothetical protein
MDDEVEQFSEHSRAALARQLAEAVLHYADATEGMRGSTSDTMRIFDLNDELEAAVVALNDRVYEHTGTIPLALHRPNDYEEQSFEDDEDDEDYLPALEASACLSVVSRWDVAVVDADELVRVGREAHLRQHPVDAAPDAEIAVPDPPAALMAIVGDNAGMWFRIPGVEP